jgi:hypothetical protein
MNIDRNDCKEREARLDWMMDEFRKAQSKRRENPPNPGLQPSMVADTTVSTKPVIDDGTLIDADTQRRGAGPGPPSSKRSTTI